ncbi:MAG: hypothetical protein O3C63_05540 [Cyanobacteria bacterium]|nr:hypothetical protein [Cyanobacteriota bacterium]MDA1021392.1 hypothetical protein [Cyanobacteriota bacterium]
MKLFLSLLIVLTMTNAVSAKLSCTDGVLIKDGQALSAEEKTSIKTKVEKKLTKVSEEKEDSKDPKKRAEKKTKLTDKLELINSCGN